MLRERIPTIVLVNSPQNSKDKTLQKIDLLQDPIYRGIVRRFDRALRLEDNGSLAEDLQMASVVNSVATHTTFMHRLRTQLGQEEDPSLNNKFNCRVTGHSIGEMASLIEEGVTDIETMAWVLKNRQEITENPVQSTLRFMVACVGIDMVKFEKGLGKITETFGDTVEAVMANRNTRWQGVLSFRAPLGLEMRAFTQRLGEVYREFTPPGVERPPGFVHLRAVKNAFHSYLLKEEELIFQRTIDPEINEQNFKHPEPGIIYSPMLRRWITTRKDGLHLLRHQITSEVYFSEGIEDILQVPGLLLFVTADIKEDVTPKIVGDNVSSRAPVRNINNMASLEAVVEETAELVRAA